MTTLLVPALEEDPWPTLGSQVCQFIEQHLVLGPGDLRGLPAKLDAEKRALIYGAYEIFPANHPKAGRRRFRRVCFSLREGMAKTELSAWIAAVELHHEGPVRCDGWRDEQPVGRPVVDGTLKGQGKSRNLRVQAGPFYDWLGDAVPVLPEWAMEYEVLPDAGLQEAHRRRTWRDRAREAYRSGPKLIIHLPGWEDPSGGEGSQIEECVVTLKETLREGIEEQWRQLRAVDLVMGEVAESSKGGSGAAGRPPRPGLHQGEAGGAAPGNTALHWAVRAAGAERGRSVVDAGDRGEGGRGVSAGPPKMNPCQGRPSGGPSTGNASLRHPCRPYFT